MFPERVLKYSNIDLSGLWGYNLQYIQLIVSRIRNGQYTSFRFKPKGLSLLKDNIAQKLGVRALGCLKIIKDYKDLELTTLDFIDALKTELGRVSGDIEVTKRELSQIFGKNIAFISAIILSLEDPYNDAYSSNYKFSKEIFSNLKRNTEIDKYSFKDFLSIIEEFINLNPDIPEYSLQQHTVSKVDVFADIFNTEAAYWLGFLCADGHVSHRGDYMIAFSLTSADKKSVEDFADFVGFDRSRIDYDVVNFKKDAKGRINRYLSTRMVFRSKIMNARLQELGFFSSKHERKDIPDFVIQAIELAKEEAIDKGIHWSQTKYGKVAHAWLLGFFDGDGTVQSGYSVAITSSSKQLLLEIKSLFESPNKVRTRVEPGTEVMVFDKLTIAKGHYLLTLGPDVFKRMLASYFESMKRKRP